MSACSESAPVAANPARVIAAIETPAEANPIVLSSMRIVLTLQSRCLDGVDCLCGDAFGEVVDPFVASLGDGSTWGTAEPGTPSFDVPSACR